MDSMAFWLVIGSAVAVAGFSVFLLQKKAGEAGRHLAELKSLRRELEAKQEALAEMEHQSNATTHRLQQQLETHTAKTDEMQGELNQLRQQLGAEIEKAEALAARIEASHSEQGQATELQQRLSAAERDRDEARTALEELQTVKAELEEKTQAIARIEKEFEARMDEVVQSSIQKITHAEQAKEEAIQAAQDNFEAAAEANARLREQEALIKQLQEG